MTNQEIKNRINKLQEEFDENTFVLSARNDSIVREILHLQTLCEHEYNEDGCCIYCGRNNE